MRYFISLLFVGLCVVASAQVPSYVPTNGLVGWWPFSGNANDESGNGNNGAVNGATLTMDRFGLAAAAYEFNGTNNYIYAGNLSSMTSSSGNGSTISLWFSSNSFQVNNSDLYDLRSNDNSANELYVNYSGQGSIDALNFDYPAWSSTGGVSSGWILNSSETVNLGSWYHMIFVQDFATNTNRIYVNGILTGDTIVSHVDLIDPTFNIGSRYDAFNWRGQYFSGMIDDIGIWNRALEPCEILALYTAGSQGISSTPVSYTGLNSNYSLADAPSTLAGSPADGYFIGPGVSGNTFDPAVAGVGTHSITYTWFDTCGGFNTAGLCTTVDQGVGIGGGNMGTGGVLVYPNPNRGQFTVELDLNGLVSLQVYDMRGALAHNEVFQATGTKTTRTLDLAVLAKGIYTVQVRNGEGVASQQVVVE